MAVKIRTVAVTVTTAGTAVPILASRFATPAFIVESAVTNSGNIYIGDATVSSANSNRMGAGIGKSFEGPDISGVTEEIDLAQVYINADTNGCVAYVTYFVREI